MRNKDIRKRAWEMSAARNVKAMALIHGGMPAGKIVAVYGESRCTTTVSIHGGPLVALPIATRTAGGTGYNKLDACLEDIFSGHGYDPLICRLEALTWLEQVHGYTVVEVL